MIVRIIIIGHFYGSNLFLKTFELELNTLNG